MKRLALVLAVLLVGGWLLAPSSAARAQALRPHAYAFLGPSFFTSPDFLANVHNNGFGGGAGFELGVAGRFGVQAEASYNGYSFSPRAVEQRGGQDAQGGGVSVYGVALRGRADLYQGSGSVTPYVTAGVGYYSRRVNATSAVDPADGARFPVVPASTDAEASFLGGVGVRLDISPRVQFLIEGNYVFVLTESVDEDRLGPLIGAEDEEIERIDIGGTRVVPLRLGVSYAF